MINKSKSTKCLLVQGMKNTHINTSDHSKYITFNNSAFTVTALINMITSVTCRILKLHLYSNKTYFSNICI